MNLYKVTCEYRQVGAIGAFQQKDFTQYAETSKQAYEQTREQLYHDNFEHVLVKKIEMEFNGMWVPVESRAYLGGE